MRTEGSSLLVGRAFQGVAAGGILVLCLSITAEIVPFHKRAIYMGLLQSSSAMSAAVGPIIGAALSQKVSWRWCFCEFDLCLLRPINLMNIAINLPTSGFALVCLFLTLRLNSRPKTSAKLLLKTFDFAGLYVFRTFICPFYHQYKNHHSFILPSAS